MAAVCPLVDAYVQQITLLSAVSAGSAVDE